MAIFTLVVYFNKVDSLLQFFLLVAHWLILYPYFWYLFSCTSGSNPMVWARPCIHKLIRSYSCYTSLPLNYIHGGGRGEPGGPKKEPPSTSLIPTVHRSAWPVFVILTIYNFFNNYLVVCSLHDLLGFAYYGRCQTYV